MSYYPLLTYGERFPVADSDLPPCMTPVPTDRATFLKGIFEGIAEIETKGYMRLAELGAPRLGKLRTIGGGAENDVWSHIRQRRLGVKMLPSMHSQAAYGAAKLARFGVKHDIFLKHT